VKTVNKKRRSLPVKGRGPNGTLRAFAKDDKCGRRDEKYEYRNDREIK